MRIIFLLIQLIVVLYHLMIIENNSYNHDYNIFSLNFILFFIYILIYSIKKNGIASSSTFFLATYFVFVGSRIFLDYLGVSNLLETNLFFFTSLSLKTAHIFLFINHSFIVVFYFVFSLFRF